MHTFYALISFKGKPHGVGVAAGAVITGEKDSPLQSSTSPYHENCFQRPSGQCRFVCVYVYILSRKLQQKIYVRTVLSPYLLYCAGAVVSVRAWELRVPSANPRYPLTTFQYLISPPSGQRLPKLLSYCPQTGLTTLICI